MEDGIWYGILAQLFHSTIYTTFFHTELVGKNSFDELGLKFLETDTLQSTGAKEPELRYFTVWWCFQKPLFSVRMSRYSTTKPALRLKSGSNFWKEVFLFCATFWPLTRHIMNPRRGNGAAVASTRDVNREVTVVLFTTIYFLPLNVVLCGWINCLLYYYMYLLCDLNVCQPLSH